MLCHKRSLTQHERSHTERHKWRVYNTGHASRNQHVIMDLKSSMRASGPCTFVQAHVVDRLTLLHVHRCTSRIEAAPEIGMLVEIEQLGIVRTVCAGIFLHCFVSLDVASNR